MYRTYKDANLPVRLYVYTDDETPIDGDGVDVGLCDVSGDVIAALLNVKENQDGNPVIKLYNLKHTTIGGVPHVRVIKEGDNFVTAQPI